MAEGANETVWQQPSSIDGQAAQPSPQSQSSQIAIAVSQSERVSTTVQCYDASSRTRRCVVAPFGTASIGGS